MAKLEQNPYLNKKIYTFSRALIFGEKAFLMAVIASLTHPSSPAITTPRPIPGHKRRRRLIKHYKVNFIKWRVTITQMLFLDDNSMEFKPYNTTQNTYNNSTNLNGKILSITSKTQMALDTLGVKCHMTTLFMWLDDSSSSHSTRNRCHTDGIDLLWYERS